VRAFARWCVWIGSVVSGVTGLVYWWMDHMMEPVSEWAVINHPLQPWVLKTHIVTAPLLVFAIGLIAMDHVWKQFRLGIRAGRRSGVSAMWVFAPMVVSGYLVQAVTAPAWLSALGWIHLGTGLAYLAGLGVHQVVVPRRRAGRRTVREVDLDVVRSGDSS
jgi:hypothetical protein